MPLSVIFIRELVGALEAHGKHAEPLLAQLQLDRAALADLRTRVAELDFEAAVREVSEALGDDALGLTIGENAPSHTLQLLSPLLLSCGSLQDALDTLTTYAPLLADDLVFRRLDDPRGVLLTFELGKAASLGSRFIADYSTAMVLRLILRFLGDAGSQQLAEVALEHEAPRRNSIGSLFGWLPLRFGSARNEIVLAPRALSVRQAYADERAHLEYREAADAILADVRRVASVADRVRSVLRTRSMLLSPSMKLVSSAVGLQPRTLARSLSAEGKSFRVLVDEARCLESCEALRQQVPIAQIAEAVGFSEPSAFHRAFRRWTGQTPAQYARQATRPRP